MSIRINKLLSQLGVCSRRDAEKLLVAGKIKLNGKILTELGTKIEPDKDHLIVDGVKVSLQNEPPKVYWMFYKPRRVLTASRGQGGKPCLFDVPSLARAKLKVASVGRLDYESEGMLLLSNDGDFVFKLSHPSYKLARIYQVKVDQMIDQQVLHKLSRKGIELEDGPLKKIDVKYMQTQRSSQKSDPGGHWYQVTVYEGRNRLVRRVIAALGCKVKRLVRTGFGEVDLDKDLGPGDFRPLKSKEIKYLRGSIRAAEQARVE